MFASVSHYFIPGPTATLPAQINSLVSLSAAPLALGQDPFAHLDHVHIPCGCGTPECAATLVVARISSDEFLPFGNNTVLITPDNVVYHYGIMLDAKGLRALQTELTYHLRSLP